MKPKKAVSNDNFIVQGSILAIAGIIVRIIGLLYRVPLTNIIGNSGIGVYSTAYSIYNILLIISSYTLPLAVSKLIAERIARGEYKNSRRLLIASCVFALISGGIFGSVCYFGADYFSELMHMPQAELAIKTMAPTIFVMAFLGVLRGYFQGHNTMVPTALSQIFEQIINAAVSLIAGWLMFKTGLGLDVEYGLTNYYSSSYGAAGGTIGTGAGAFAAFIFCLAVYYLRKNRIDRLVASDRSKKQESYGYIMKVITMTIFPVLISTTIFSISTIIDQAIYAAYMNTDYTDIWGAYSGKYTLMINLPVSIASSLGAAVIPALASAVQKGTKSEIVSKASMAVRFNMVIAIPAAVGLAVLSGPVFNMLFTGGNDQAIDMMIIGSSAIVFIALATIMNSVLQGTSNIWLPVRNAIISIVFHTIILAIFLWVFDMGINGVIFANILFYIFICLLNYKCLKRKLDYMQEIKKTFVCPLIASAVMGIIAYFVNNTIYNLCSSYIVSVLVAICVSVVVYFIVLILSKGIDEVDLIKMPFGRTIVSVAKTLHLISRV